MNHTLRMLIGCLVPLALIFVLPLFGVGSGATLAIFIVLMFFCHLMMIGGHHHGSHQYRSPEEGKDHHSHQIQSKEMKDE